MDRRENLKILVAGTMATGLLLTTGCKEEKDSATTTDNSLGYGRTVEEAAHDSKIAGESFFNEKEMKMVSILSDIIIPADDISGSATSVGVPDFIEFMMKDDPKLQTPMRGGLMWLENLSLATFGLSFIVLAGDQHLVLVEKIAWPDQQKEGMQHGIKFFNMMRNLVCTGFFTSKEGVKDIGYVGNRPNQWDGVPQEVLDKYGLSYDEKMLKECLKIEDQQKIISWDDQGNIIG